MFEKVKKLLDEKGITLYKLSKDTGISKSSLSEWKSGKYNLKVDKLKKIADYLGVKVDDLL